MRFPEANAAGKGVLSGRVGIRRLQSREWIWLQQVVAVRVHQAK